MAKPLSSIAIAKFTEVHAPLNVFKIPSDGPTTALYVSLYTSPDGAYSQGEILLTELPTHRHKSMTQSFGVIRGSVKMSVDGKTIPRMFGAMKKQQCVCRGELHSAVSLLRTPAVMTVLSIPPWDPVKFELEESK